jgi:hypothetical protein
MEPGQGFEVVKTERGDLWISGDILARYLNQLPADQTSVSIPAGFLLAGPGMARAQDPTGGDATELATASQNPVGDLVSLPFQFNFNSGGAFEDRTFFNLNFQPVMPIKVTPDVNLIARTIVPVVSIPGPEGLRFSGVADIQQQLFFTASSPGKIIWAPTLELAKRADALHVASVSFIGGYAEKTFKLPNPVYFLP